LILDLKHFTIFPTKSQYLFEGRKIKMAVTEKTTKEKLIEFILNLTDEECKMIISVLSGK